MTGNPSQPSIKTWRITRLWTCSWIEDDKCYLTRSALWTRGQLKLVTNQSWRECSSTFFWQTSLLPNYVDVATWGNRLQNNYTYLLFICIYWKQVILMLKQYCYGHSKRLKSLIPVVNDYVIIWKYFCFGPKWVSIMHGSDLWYGTHKDKHEK